MCIVVCVCTYVQKMEEMWMRKVRRNVTLPEDVDKEFRDIVARLEGPLKKGAFGKWFTNVLKDFITSYSKQQQVANNEQFADAKRKEIMKTRELMQKIRKVVFWEGIEINRGIGLPEKYLMEAIIKVKNLSNNPRDRRTPYKWIRKLIEYEFIRKSSYNMYEILDTGQDWSELEHVENAGEIHKEEVSELK
jgi:hypothetical protein